MSSCVVKTRSNEIVEILVWNLNMYQSTGSIWGRVDTEGSQLNDLTGTSTFSNRCQNSCNLWWSSLSVRIVFKNQETTADRKLLSDLLLFYCVLLWSGAKLTFLMLNSNVHYTFQGSIGTLKIPCEAGGPFSQVSVSSPSASSRQAAWLSVFICSSRPVLLAP